MKTALTLLLVLSGAPAAFAQSKVIDKTVPLAATGRIGLDTHNGTIAIRTWQRPEVQVHVQIDAASSWPQDLRRFNDTTVDVTSTADTVAISTVDPDAMAFWNWFGSGPTIHYTVTAPATARWTVRTHNGDTDVRDVNAAFDIETHNGGLRMQNLAGPLRIASHNGGAVVDFGAFQGASIELHNGSAELTLPRASRFDLRMASRNGDLRSDFPMLTRAADRRGGNVEATVNGGGSTLQFDSRNGGLQLRAK